MYFNDCYIACLCEGTAEETIMNILLDNDLLVFDRSLLIEEKPLRVRKGADFEMRYLRKGFSKPVTVIRILDSRREKFRLSKEYEHKVQVINVITSPEIEMLIIHSEGKYKEFEKSGLKPSDFCKQKLGYKNVKSAEFIRDYFSEHMRLVKAIREHGMKAKRHKGEYLLSDILR